MQLIVSSHNFSIFDFSDVQRADANRDDDALLCRAAHVLRRSGEESRSGCSREDAEDTRSSRRDE